MAYSYFTMATPEPYMLLPQTTPLVAKLWNMRVLCAPYYFWPMMALWWITCGLDSLLFFFRVRAVFAHSCIARSMFSALWALIGVAPIPFLYSGLYYGNHCPGVAASFSGCPAFSWFTLSMLLAAAAYNTLIFVGVSGELSRITPGGKLSLRVLLTGDGLYTVSKSLLRSCQIYYVVTMALLVLQAINIWSWNPNGWYAYVIGEINQTISCCLSYRLFRKLLFCQREQQAQGKMELRTEDVEMMVNAALITETHDADAP
ncbi:hypothetical protein HWV62_4657 [Athelia sp. TMB]|nr:hypothetical protein HWV62_4657 [Athelia sp. TMB]